MDSLKCPITGELFEDPVMGSDGHTYERAVIVEWLKKHGTSPITREPMDINTLRTNHAIKKSIDEFNNSARVQQNQYEFKLDIHIRKTKPQPLLQNAEKVIEEVEWIGQPGPPIVLLQINGFRASREAQFYVQLSSHPHIVRTFGLVKSDPGSVRLLQEFAKEGDLSELLREKTFRPTERVLQAIFVQITDAMIFLADHEIVHGDLACRNVLVFQSNAVDPNKNLVKLTDFGLTRNSRLYSLVATPSATTKNTIIPECYAAPEILQSMDWSNCSPKSDVFSMGVLMWEACSYGEIPYASCKSTEEIRRRKLNNERLPKPLGCSDALWANINRCWSLQPNDRPDFRTLRQNLLANQEIPNIR